VGLAGSRAAVAARREQASQILGNRND
jgi:hypothetical protein